MRPDRNSGRKQIEIARQHADDRARDAVRRVTWRPITEDHCEIAGARFHGSARHIRCSRCHPGTKCSSDDGVQIQDLKELRSDLRGQDRQLFAAGVTNSLAPQEKAATSFSSLLPFHAAARSSRVSERTRRNFPFRLITHTWSGSGMGEETNDRICRDDAAVQRQQDSDQLQRTRSKVEGERRNRSLRCRNSCRSKRNQNAAGKALQQNLANSSFRSRVS